MPVSCQICRIAKQLAVRDLRDKWELLNLTLTLILTEIINTRRLREIVHAQWRGCELFGSVSYLILALASSSSGGLSGGELPFLWAYSMLVDSVLDDWQLPDQCWVVRDLSGASRRTDQPPLTHILRTTRLKFFGHIARVDPSTDHSRVLRSSVTPLPRDWNRRSGRPRQTWLRTVESDVAPLNIGLATLPVIEHKIDRHGACSWKRQQLVITPLVVKYFTYVNHTPLLSHPVYSTINRLTCVYTLIALYYLTFFYFLCCMYILCQQLRFASCLINKYWLIDWLNNVHWTSHVMMMEPDVVR